MRPDILSAVPKSIHYTYFSRYRTFDGLFSTEPIYYQLYIECLPRLKTQILPALRIIYSTYPIYVSLPDYSPSLLGDPIEAEERVWYEISTS